MIQLSKQIKHAPSGAQPERGVSLLIVVLVASIIVLTVVSTALIAKRTIQSSQSYTEALQGAYTTEDAFNCVRWWLTNNTPNPEDSFEVGSTIECAGNTITITNAMYDLDPGRYSTTTFEIITPPGNVEVEVVRDQSRPTRFVGKVYLHGYNVDEAGAPRRAERLRVYDISFGSDYQGADVMLAIDRSGSIEPPSTASRGGVTQNDGTEWGDVLEAVVGVTDIIAQEIPISYVGYITFGTDRGDVGEQVTQAECEESWLETLRQLGIVPTAADIANATTFCASNLRFRKPDRSLTDPRWPVDGGSRNVLIDDSGTPGNVTDDVPLIKNEAKETNMSLGLAIAAMELEGLYYPGDDGTFAGTTIGDGAFERHIAEWADNVVPPAFPGAQPTFSGLPYQEVYPDPTFPGDTAPGWDRDDSLYPDYIVLVTDGQPNGIIRHDVDDTVDCNYAAGGSNTTEAGDAIFFRPDGTSNPGEGCLVDTFNVGDPLDNYAHCNDRGIDFSGTVDPLDYNNPPNISFPSNTYRNPPKCNTFIIAEAIKARGIVLTVIGVGDDIDSDFLQSIASDDGAGGKRYIEIDDYDDLLDVFIEFRELIIPTTLL